jgi:outer membrane receptor protein involved in Fe transport
LYGAGSEGGLLKYVTNPPDPTKFAAAVQAGGEDVAHGEAAGSGKGMINLPIGDRAAFRLSGYYEGLPGYVNDPSLGEKNISVPSVAARLAEKIFQDLARKRLVIIGAGEMGELTVGAFRNRVDRLTIGVLHSVNRLRKNKETVFSLYEN